MSATRSDLTSRVWREQAARVKERDGYQCQACGATDDLTVDHITPHAIDSGARADHELVTLCRSCNSRKGASLMVRIDYRAPGWF